MPLTSATSVEPLFGLYTDHPFPSQITAGQPYFHTCSFSSAYNTNIIIQFNVIQPDICLNEWNATLLFNDIPIPLTENNPGNFTTPVIKITKTNYVIKTIFQSHPNVIPSQYTFEVKILSENMETISYDSSHRRRPTPTPTPVPFLNEGKITAESTPVTIIAQCVPLPETSTKSKFYIGFFIFVIIGSVIMYRINKTKKKVRKHNP